MDGPGQLAYFPDRMLPEASACPFHARSGGKPGELTVTPGKADSATELGKVSSLRPGHRPSKLIIQAGEIERSACKAGRCKSRVRLRSGDGPPSVRVRPSSLKRDCKPQDDEHMRKCLANVHAKSRLTLEPLRTLRAATKGQAGACPDRTRAIPCKVRVGLPPDGVRRVDSNGDSNSSDQRQAAATGDSA
jgi:hypothetical protein